MSNIVLQSKSGPDSKLHLEVPVSQPNAEFEVEIAIRAKQSGTILPPGYFDVIGSVKDETFIVHPQPPLPPPVKFE